jgi:hypothetical protein
MRNEPEMATQRTRIEVEAESLFEALGSRT